MRHSAGRRVLASRSAAAQAQRVGRGPLETPTRGDKPLDPKVEGSLVGCARGYALSYVAGGGVGARSAAIGSVVCFLGVCVSSSAILSCSPIHQVTMMWDAPFGGEARSYEA
jgi:hypothetical protein